MKRFAELLDRLSYEPGRNNKLWLMTQYLRAAPDPERGYALAALTGALAFRHAKPGMIRALISERADPILFELSHDYVGDLSETVALMWQPQPAAASRQPTLSEVVTGLSSLGKAALPGQLARWLDALDETGRWALLKLVTGELRIGVSARLAKSAVAALAGKDAQEVELIWNGLRPPYVELFAWLEGRTEKPISRDPAPFRPAMLAHAVDESDLSALDPADFMGEWKWDGIRVQAVAGVDGQGRAVARLYSRTGEDISASFPDLLAALRLPGAIDGELLIVREGRVESFNVLQQRLNRKTVNEKLLSEFPAHLRAYDLLVEGDEDLRGLPFTARRRRLEGFVARLQERRIDLSPLVVFSNWEELAAARANPAAAGAGEDAEASCSSGAMQPMWRDAPEVHGGNGSATPSWSTRCSCMRSAVTASAPHTIPTTPSECGARATRAMSWCPSARPISASPTRSSLRSTGSCDAIPWNASVRCARWCTRPTEDWCWKWHSRGCSARAVTNRASRCGFPASTGCAGTSRPVRRIALKCSKECWRRSVQQQRIASCDTVSP